MGYNYGNIRDKEITQSQGKDFRDTDVVSGEAPKGHMGDSNNSTEQYMAGKAVIGSKGGNANHGKEGG